MCISSNEKNKKHGLQEKVISSDKEFSLACLLLDSSKKRKERDRRKAPD